MHRARLLERLGLRSKARGKQRNLSARLRVEPLEERRLLTAYNLLVSTFNDSSGKSVLEYNDATDLRLPTGAFTGYNGLTNADGLAVAPDGSFYVSVSSGPDGSSGEVLHYSQAVLS